MLTVKPRFEVVESWDNSGDVVIYFRDTISNGVKDIVKQELANNFKGLEPHKRNVYHLEEMVNDIFAKIIG